MSYVFGEIKVESAESVNFGVGEMVVAFGALHDDELERAGKNVTCVAVDIKSDDS